MSQRATYFPVLKWRAVSREVEDDWMTALIVLEKHVLPQEPSHTYARVCVCLCVCVKGGAGNGQCGTYVGGGIPEASQRSSISSREKAV